MAKKKAAKPSPAAKKPSPKKKVNKSQAIRDYAAKHQGAGPTEIARALTKEGIKVSPPLVSNVLGAAKKKKSKRRVTTVKAAGRPASSDKVSLGDLVATQAFAEKVGGVESAKNLLKAIEKLG